ncbi:radiation-inducible immediate-early gene IEX-1-like [Labrus bergylta]|uniref:radiation-inducible immediate-early gene IEX-1-like n=1 Tax=Labrus bergylta TaxID=56723 RepID=UPI003313F503
MSSSSCRLLPVALGPLEATSTITFNSFSSSSSSSSLRPSPPRGRRPRRVLYPACQSRKPQLREAPDQALRWLLLLSAVVFLQIYSEESHTCADLQNQSPAPAASLSQEGDGSLGTVQGWTGEEPWRVHTMGGASETECVVA